jgi:hypothetical protein
MKSGFALEQRKFVPTSKLACFGHGDFFEMIGTTQ